MDLLRRARAIAARLPGWAIVIALGGVAAIALAGCITEGCIYPDEMGASAEVPMALDAAHPIATTSFTVDVTAQAFASDVPGHGARLQLSLDPAAGVTLALVPDGSTAPIPLVMNNGVASLPLDRCAPDQACHVAGRVVVALVTDDPPAGSQPVTLKVEALARVPRTDKKCGLGRDPVILATTPPVSRPAGSVSTTPSQVHDRSEIVQHVTVRFPGADTPDGTGPTPTAALTFGHLRIDPDPKPPADGGRTTSVPGLWLRVTPDDGGPPVLDAPVPSRYPVLPGDATFPIDPCDRSCERGYWIQAVVYDPANHSFGEADSAVYAWSLDVRTSPNAEGPAPDTAPVAVELDTSARTPPPSLVMRGTGPSFRVDASHPATTLAIDAATPARPDRPFGDALGDVTIVFDRTTSLVDEGPQGHGNQGGKPGQPWLSNGHYIGDGTDGDDRADTGATGGPSTVSSPPGRPFAACAGTGAACRGRIGLVQRWYSSDFSPSVPYDVAWTWTVVGAPAGTTVEVAPLPGETLDAAAPAAWSVQGVAVAATGAVVAGLIAVLAIRRRSRRAVTRDER